MSFLSNRNKGVNTPVHGGLKTSELRALGLSPDRVIDFSVNINPLGPSPQARAALNSIDISAYPDPESLELKEALCRATGVPLNHIVIGNGTTEIIHLLVHTCTSLEDSIAILTPTFGEYETAGKRSGVRIIKFPASQETGFRWDIAAVCQEIRQYNPQLVFLCNPNNPTGLYLPEEDVIALLDALDNGILVIDDSYTAFATEPWNTTNVLNRSNVVILHSMTKEYAIAGLRLGYALCPEPLARLLSANQPTWNINSVAQVMGLASLSDQEHLVRSRSCIEEAKAFLQPALQNLGFHVLPSAANFFLVQVGNASILRHHLLRKALCVRDCSSFGLPTYIRIGIRTVSECKQLVDALQLIVSDNEESRAGYSDASLCVLDGS